MNNKPISRFLSPVVVCYVVGISLGTFGKAHIDIGISKDIQGLSIIIAIPLLLMTSNFISWLPKAKGLLGAYFIAFTSVLTGCLVAFFVFRSYTVEAWIMSSMFFAGFTGTNANLNAAGIALHCPEDLLLLVNLADMMTGAIYLILLTSIAHPLLSKILPKYQSYTKGLFFEDEKSAHLESTNDKVDFSYISSYRMKKAGKYLIPLLLSIAILGVTVLLEMFILPSEGMNETFLILGVTVIGILASFNAKVRTLKSSYTIGNYLLLVFCVALGTTIDVKSILSESSLVILFAGLVTIVTIICNVGLAWIFKIDADTTIITATSTIFGPAFIGQVAMAMKNKEIIFSGMIVSMFGIAVANFSALGLAYLLKLI